MEDSEVDNNPTKCFQAEPPRLLELGLLGYCRVHHALFS